MPFQYDLPSGNTITFREPRNKDRQYVLGMVQPTDKMSVDEVLAAHCIEAINDVPVKDPDPRRRMEIWSIKDSQMYVALFLEMFTVNEGDMGLVRETAKKLLRIDSEPTSESTSAQS